MILQNDFKQFQSKFSLFWPPNGLNKNICCHLICSFRSFGRSDRDLFAPCPHQNIASGCSPVHFSPPEPRQPKWVYASLQQFCQFRIRSAVFFVPSMLRTPFLQNITLFSQNMLPALGGKHDFESGTKAKSWTMCLSGPPIMPVCTLFAPLIATWDLQNPLEKCVFFVYSPFSEATFSIVCFIAWLRCEISTFLHRIWPPFVRKCSPHSVLQKRKLMQHMFW